MEDGPKLLPQWLRGSSSALHNRGDSGDTSKRAKPAGADSSRPAPQAPDAWVPRNPSAAPNNGYGSSSSLAPAKASLDFARPPERGSQTERSWKPRGDNGGYGGSSLSAQPRPGYGPPPLKAGIRDERDAGISLKPGGAAVYGSAARAYSRSVAESDGGAVGGGAGGGRLDRPQDGWAPAFAAARPLSTGGGSGGGGPGRGDDSGRSPLRNGMANGSVGGPSQASFDKDFPSLRPVFGSTSSLSGGTGSGPTAAGTPSSAPLATAASSPLLDTACSGSGSSQPAPYRQTFLSSRTSSNWTSKLAEAPAAPYRSPSPAPADEDPSAASQPTAAITPSLAPAPPPLAAAPAPAPAPAVPPRPAGVWGTSAAAATVAAAAAGSESANGPPATVATGVSASSRARLEQLAVRQSKQLIPVISGGGAKSKGAGALGGGASVAAGSAGRAGAAKPAAPAAAGMLKMVSSGGKAVGEGVPAGGGAGGAPRARSGSTVILAKKASQPLDRPLTLGRAASASSPQSATEGTPPAPGTASAGPTASNASVVQSTSAGNLAAFGGGGASSAGGAAISAIPYPLQALETAGQGGEQQSGTAASEPCRTGQAQEDQALSPVHLSQAPLQQPGELAVGTQVQAAARSAPFARTPSQPALLQVSEEEEAFLRSLGWTGFDEEEGEEGDAALTEEEIEAFRRQQQQQQVQHQHHHHQVPGAGMPAGQLGPTAGLGPMAGAATAQQQVAVSAVSVVSVAAAVAAAPKAVPAPAAGRRGKPLIVAASYGSEPICSSSDSDSECE